MSHWLPIWGIFRSERRRLRLFMVIRSKCGPCRIRPECRRLIWLESPRTIHKPIPATFLKTFNNTIFLQTDSSLGDHDGWDRVRFDNSEKNPTSYRQVFVERQSGHRRSAYLDTVFGYHYDFLKTKSAGDNPQHLLKHNQNRTLFETGVFE